MPLLASRLLAMFRLMGQICHNIRLKLDPIIYFVMGTYVDRVDINRTTL